MDDLLSQTKDMRVAVYLIRCLVSSDGLTGVENGLALLRGYVEGFWPEVHPMLDEEDDNDPTFRVNTLSILCDQAGFLKDLQECPLVSSRVVGRFCLKDILGAEEQEKSDSQSKQSGGGSNSEEENTKTSGPTLDVINAAFTDIETSILTETAQSVRLSTEHVIAIEAAVTTQVGASRSLSMKPLERLFTQMSEILQTQMERLGVHQQGPSVFEDEDQSIDSLDGTKLSDQGSSS